MGKYIMQPFKMKTFTYQQRRMLYGISLSEKCNNKKIGFKRLKEL